MWCLWFEARWSKTNADLRHEKSTTRIAIARVRTKTNMNTFYLSFVVWLNRMCHATLDWARSLNDDAYRNQDWFSFIHLAMKNYTIGPFGLTETTLTRTQIESQMVYGWLTSGTRPLHSSSDCYLACSLLLSESNWRSSFVKSSPLYDQAFCGFRRQQNGRTIVCSTSCHRKAHNFWMGPCSSPFRKYKSEGAINICKRTTKAPRRKRAIYQGRCL